jgi:hypothetical protein
LATTYPVTGGAMTYVGERMEKVWSCSCGFLGLPSQQFYAAYLPLVSLISKCIHSNLPIIPVALAVIIWWALCIFAGETGRNVQIVLGGFMLVCSP